ncbi:hypothetical protein EE612_059199 [Oryza sativa]|nr:hypothetical protein EE612_059199 [Oryza sativa]
MLRNTLRSRRRGRSTTGAPVPYSLPLLCTRLEGEEKKKNGRKKKRHMTNRTASSTIESKELTWTQMATLKPREILRRKRKRANKEIRRKRDSTATTSLSRLVYTRAFACGVL